jgi:hypothetical protein
MRDEKPTIKAHERGSIEIGAFLNFTLYFYPFFSIHLGFLIAP